MEGYRALLLEESCKLPDHPALGSNANSRGAPWNSRQSQNGHPSRVWPSPVVGTHHAWVELVARFRISFLGSLLECRGKVRREPFERYFPK